jgi:3-hydroxybutyryl-CoA dehydrogenase
MSEIITEQLNDFALSVQNRPKMLFSKVGIVGCGTTGQSITIMIASRGIEVVFLDIEEAKIQEAIVEIGEQLDEKINHWGMTESEKKLIMSRIKGTLTYKDFKDCDIVIESILSKTREYSRDIRKGIFHNIEENVSSEAIIATNSSTSVITELSADLKHKDRCISLHFSTTAPNASIVEVVRGLYSSPLVCENIRKFCKLINKIPIAVEESPGVVSVRLGVALIAEACELLMEGVSNKEDIDFVARHGLGLALGPFEMADKIGIDRVERWMENLYREFGDVKYKAPPIIKKLVRAKHFGRKTCEGFYNYDSFGKKLKNQEAIVDCPKK